MADPDPSIRGAGEDGQDQGPLLLETSQDPLSHSGEIDGDDRFGLGSLVRLPVPWGEEARAFSELPDSLSEPLDDP